MASVESSDSWTPRKSPISARLGLLSNEAARRPRPAIVAVRRVMSIRLSLSYGAECLPEDILGKGERRFPLGNLVLFCAQQSWLPIGRNFRLGKIKTPACPPHPRPFRRLILRPFFTKSARFRAMRRPLRKLRINTVALAREALSKA